jgi:hypothetical protein
MRSVPWIQCALALAAAATLALPAAAAFVVDDIQVCNTDYSIVDPEFDAATQQMVYIDAVSGIGSIRLVQLQSDGTVPSSNCKGFEVDPQGMLFPFIANQKFYGNGPEFGFSQAGLEIFYTRQENNLPVLARAWWPTAGVLQKETLSNGTQRGAVLPSYNSADTRSRLLYVRNSGQGAYEADWRESNDPLTEALVPNPLGINSYTGVGGAPRWVRAAGSQRRSLALTKPGLCGRQAAQYFIDTQSFEPISNCETATPSQNRDEVWIWEAPEFGGAMTAIAIVNTNCLEVYKKTGSIWAKINEFRADNVVTGAPNSCALGSQPTNIQSHFYSPEFSVVKGRSYVAIQRGDAVVSGPSDIWVIPIDSSQGATPFKVSGPAANMTRTEPEWFVTSQGAYVFYTGKTPTSSGKLLQRAATGL